MNCNEKDNMQKVTSGLSTDAVNRVYLTGEIKERPTCKTIPGTLMPKSFFILRTKEQRLKMSGGIGVESIGHRVYAYGKLAERCHDTLRAGDRVRIEGRLKSEFKERKDGVPWFKNYVLAETVEVV